MHVKKNAPDARFLNVDLDVYSRADLQALVDALGKNVMALYVGRERRMYSAHLELAGVRKPSADSTIRAFCARIRALPKRGRELWNGAKTREFSVGVQAGQQPVVASDFRIEARTVKEVSAVGAAIVLTVYGPERSKGGSASNQPGS